MFRKAIITLFRYGLSNFSNTTNCVQHSASSVDQVKLLKTKVRIGRGYSSQVNKFLNGPVHTTGRKLLLDTTQDALNSVDRAQLKSAHEVNQRNYCFLESTCFLTLNDIEILTQYEDEKMKLEPFFKQKEKNIKLNNKSIKSSRSTKSKNDESFPKGSKTEKLKPSLVEKQFNRPN